MEACLYASCWLELIHLIGMRGEILDSGQQSQHHVVSSTRLDMRAPTGQYFSRMRLLARKKKAEWLGSHVLLTRDSKEASAPSDQEEMFPYLCICGDWGTAKSNELRSTSRESCPWKLVCNMSFKRYDVCSNVKRWPKAPDQVGRFEASSHVTQTKKRNITYLITDAYRGSSRILLS